MTIKQDVLKAMASRIRDILARNHWLDVEAVLRVSEM